MTEETGFLPAGALLLLLLTSAAGAQGSLSSSYFTSDCTVLLPAAGSASSATAEAVTVVGGVSSVQMTGTSLEHTFTVLCVDVRCGTSLCGDCDLNGRVNILDALLAAGHAVGRTVLVGTPFANCDVDGDLDVDVLDALLLGQASVGLAVTLSCC